MPESGKDPGSEKARPWYLADPAKPAANPASASDRLKTPSSPATPAAKPGSVSDRLKPGTSATPPATANPAAAKPAPAASPASASDRLKPVAPGGGSSQSDRLRIGGSAPARPAPAAGSGLKPPAPSSTGGPASPPTGNLQRPLVLTGATPRARLDQLLDEARRRKASDLHLTVDLPVLMRINGTLERIGDPLPAKEAQALAVASLDEGRAKTFEKTGDVDFCYTVGVARYRANVCRHRTGVAATFRVVKDRVPTLAELGIPTEAERLTSYAQGLVLVTGPLGAGKTTTAFALADLVNKSRHDHIITIEDPIEFMLPTAKCQVSQRELGTHTRSFEAALRGALRENPDVIVIGDLRDYETARLAIAAAETGHLVIASMPSMSAAKTIDKLIDMFPAGEQATTRVMVSESLRGILSQRLLPGTKGEQVVAVELLFGSVAIANMIRDGKTSALKNAMQTGRAAGMRALDFSIGELVAAGAITKETGDAALAG